MNERELLYIEKLAKTSCKNGLENKYGEILKHEELINDLLFYSREYRLQNEVNNPLITRSYGRLLNADKELIKETVITKLFFNTFGHCEIEYPENKKFAVCLTHDVDDIYPSLAHIALSSLYCIRNLNLKELKKQLFWKIRRKEDSPYWNFKEIMNLEEKYSAKSSFYFLATDKDIRRFRYNIEDLENELGFIVDKGWEVGLHGGYYAYNNLEEMKKEKKRLEKVLGKKVIGYRNHYLRFKVPDTWELLAEAGFKYDTTFGYNDMVGFRNGMCHPFKPFDLSRDREINILEIPLTIGDGTLFYYIKDLSEAWTIVKKLIDTVEKYNGVITLLWHSNIFNCAFRDRWVRLYEKILKYCHEKNAWMTSGEEIWRWWKNDEQG
jgi:peptidoglycan/xylan/chitin deacetylase (PgdA/CDA1 family)